MPFISSREYSTFKIFRSAKDGYYAETTSEIIFADEKKGLKVNVPKGFRTDFASVPKNFQHIISPIGKHAQASVLHDYLYAKNSYASTINAGGALKVSRKTADKIFYNAMRESSVNVVTAWIMWAMVRAFGYFSFHKREF